MDILVPISFFVVIAMVIKTISDNKVRKQIVERGTIDKNLKYLGLSVANYRALNSLKWGLVAIALGLAFWVGQNAEEELVLAYLFIFGGVALVLYYILERFLIKHPDPNEPDDQI